MSAPDAILFISFGGPEKRDEVMPFLEIVTQGRNIPRARIEAVAHHYDAIGGASPINKITRQQAEGLKKTLAAQGCDLPVYVGNRNWHPFIEQTLRQMANDGVRTAVGFITAAHRAEASLERYMRAVEAAREKIGAAAPVIRYAGPWFDHPLFIEAICDRITKTLDQPAGRPADSLTDAWIFTAHSIPCAMADDSAYVSELRRTAALVCEHLGRREWSLAYSSRSGNPQEPWLEPDVCDAIEAKARAGITRAVAIPIGFIADHVEVLFDLDIEAKEAAQKTGIEFLRVPTVGDHPAFLRMMSDVVCAR